MATNLLDEYQEDYDALIDKFDEFNELENIILGVVKNPTTGQLTSKVTDFRTFGLNLEAVERSLSQPPQGLVRALDLDDMGKSLLGQMILYKYFIPNDKIPYSHLTKLRMWAFASKIYGASYMMYDICYREGYTGVATSLLPVRSVILQKGRHSIKDSDHVWVESYVSPKWVEDLKGQEGVDPEVIKNILKGADKQKDEEKMSEFEKQYNTKRVATDQCHILTKYQTGTDGVWSIIDPDTGKTAKEMVNPHESDRIPISDLHCVPFGDNPFGISNVQRSKPVQQTMDSLIKLYLRGVEMSVFPPIIGQPNILKYGLDYSPGALWIEQVPNSIRRFDTNPQGMQTFQEAYSFFNGTLLNQYGTTDTTVTREGALDPGYGKTPAALAKLDKRENTVDAFSKAMLDEAIEDLYDGVVDLFCNQMVVPIPIDLFDKEIDEIVNSGYPDVLEMVQKSSSGNYAQINIDPDYMKGEQGYTKYRFFIEPGTTEKADKQEQYERLEGTLVALTKIPGAIQEVKKTGKMIDLGEWINAMIANSGIDNQLKLIRPMTEEEQQKFAMEQTQAQLGQGAAGGEMTADATGASVSGDGGGADSELLMALEQATGAQGGAAIPANV